MMMIMIMQCHDHRQLVRMRGTAMAETVLVMPLILVLLAAMLFLAATFEQEFRQTAAVRYEAWRRAAIADGPMLIGEGELINQAFLQNEATGMTWGIRYSEPVGADSIYVDTAFQYSDDAGSYMAALLDPATPDGGGQRRMGSRVWLSSDYTPPLNPTTLGTMSLAGTRHSRLYHEWKYSNRYAFDTDFNKERPTNESAYRVDNMAILQDVLMPELDRLENLGGNPLGDVIHGLAIRPLPYLGPELPRDWWIGVPYPQGSSGLGN